VNGAPFKIMECLIKRFPLGQYSQTVVEAALQMREKVASPEDIAEIQIETVTTAIVLMADTPEKWEPPNRETADHSMPYTVAVALIHGDVQEEHFDDAHVFDPAIRALTRKVKIKASAEADKHMPHAMRCYFKVMTKSGETFSTVVDHHKGHWKNPMDDAGIEQKFRTLARKVLPDAKINAMLARMWQLEKIEDAGEIVRLTLA
jgi:2-methylcitrate dehydratase